jgi:hypothetical protein
LEKTVCVSNDNSGFKATSIFPLNPNAIPGYFFSIADNSMTPRQETEPQPTSLESSPSSATDQTVGHAPSKHLLEIRPVPKIPILFKRD